MSEAQPSEPVTCSHCAKTFTSLSISFSEFISVRAGYSDTLGYVCDSCDMPLCKDCCEQNRIRYDSWNGWSKSKCVRCGEQFTPNDVFLPEDRPDLLEPPEEDDSLSGFDLVCVVLVSVVVTVGMAVCGYILSEESVPTAVVSGIVAGSLLWLGIRSAKRGSFWSVYGVVTVVTAVLSLASCASGGLSEWVALFIAFNAMMSYGTGAKLYFQMFKHDYAQAGAV